jgi:ligand-binding SRPBCC domain-containing protein
MKGRMEHLFLAEQVIDRPMDEVFQFFSDAQNLQRITPPLLEFNILTPLPIKMQKGTLIDYRMKVRGIPMRWKTLIEEWTPPHRFTDTQLKGPYSFWHHTHEFSALSENRTLMKDRVRYRVGWGVIGRVINHLVVKRDIEKIFAFRKSEIEKLFRRSHP